MRLQRGISLKRNQLRVGQTYKVLVTDQNETGMLLGRSEFEAPETDGEILFTAKRKPETGSFVNVRITKAGAYDLMGEMIG